MKVGAKARDKQHKSSVQFSLANSSKSITGPSAFIFLPCKICSYKRSLIRNVSTLKMSQYLEKQDISLMHLSRPLYKLNSDENGTGIREGWLYQIGWIFGKVLKGGGSFSIQKFQVLNLYKRFLSIVFRQNCNTIFRKWGEGGDRRPLGIFPKIHPIWYSHSSLLVSLAEGKH